MAILTDHAREQITSRGVVTESEVLRAVEKHKDYIARATTYEVRVIVKRISYTYLPDESNGDLVIACVTTGRRQVVKTVMLQRSGQVWWKSNKLGQRKYYVE